MSQFHEVTPQLNFLRQCLLQDKIPIGLFLSAGCPLSIKIKDGNDEKPLIPDIAGLTETIHEKMKGMGNPIDPYNKLYSQFAKDDKENPNIEDILSHIRSLRKVVGNDTVRDLSGIELDNLDKKICEEIVSAVTKELPDFITPYHNMSAWIKAISRKCSVEIFTTNYDLLIEQALEKYKVPYFDGFIGSKTSFFDSYAIEEDIFPSRWAKLWKLHGSINWFQCDDGTISRGFTQEVNPGLCRVIHPSHLKYDESRRMPYLAMIDRLRKFIKQPNSVLITCGYSFHDDHINTNLLDSLRSNPTAILFALVYGDLKNYPDAVNIAKFTSNFNIYSRNEAIIGTKRGIWGEKNDLTPDTSGIIQDADENSMDDKNYRQVLFNLGDFSIFGSQLQEMIGSRNIVERELYAK
jgi:hypothetical protein